MTPLRGNIPLLHYNRTLPSPLGLKGVTLYANNVVTDSKHENLVIAETIFTKSGLALPDSSVSVFRSEASVKLERIPQGRGLSRGLHRPKEFVVACLN